jgi:hypothetical protein
MQMRTPPYWFIFVTVLFAWGCGTGVVADDSGSVSDSVAFPLPPKTCGMSELVDVRSGIDASMGVFETSNDSNHLYLTFAPAQGLDLQSISVYCGELEQLPRSLDGKSDPTQFTLKYEGLSGNARWSTKVPSAGLPKCLFVSAWIKVASPNAILEGWAGKSKDTLATPGLTYCRQKCELRHLNCSLEEESQTPITYLQQQWATADASTLLRNDFGKLFPDGIVLGCNVQCKFASAEQALGALPMDGPAIALAAGTLSGSKVNNRLVGELLSLSMVIRIDETQPTFSQDSPQLADLQVAIGAFEGWNVREVVNEANSVLGGCTSNYTPAQIYEVVLRINKSFAKTDGQPGFLRCPIN